ncbi:MAG: rhomboid family protein [Verrucomicrobiae bacterium]|nr:rhomboid family protein [Verrucomicrobiae bacterium]
MSTPLAKTTCLVHPSRPAAARCPSCGAFYCAECITEHEGRLTCARCLAAGQKAPDAAEKKRIRLPISPLLQFAIGLFLVWLIYLAFARILLSIPADFHDGTVWK